MFFRDRWLSASMMLEISTVLDKIYLLLKGITAGKVGVVLSNGSVEARAPGTYKM